MFDRLMGDEVRLSRRRRDRLPATARSNIRPIGFALRSPREEHRALDRRQGHGFNNMLSDSRSQVADGSGLLVDFAALAASLGAHVEDVRGSKDINELRAAYLRAREVARTTRRPVVVCTVDHQTWTEAVAWWETGVPTSLSGRTSYEQEKRRQVRWL